MRPQQVCGTPSTHVPRRSMSGVRATKVRTNGLQKITTNQDSVDVTGTADQRQAQTYTALSFPHVRLHRRGHITQLKWVWGRRGEGKRSHGSRHGCNSQRACQSTVSSGKVESHVGNTAQLSELGCKLSFMHTDAKSHSLTRFKESFLFFDQPN